MTFAKFIRIHTLTTYGANNLNRDDLSRPKTMTFGGVLRMRLSSQCVKRAWRCSDVMKEVVSGVRTRAFWVHAAKEQLANHALADVMAHIEPLRLALEGVKAGQKDDDGENSQVGLPADDPTEAAAAAPAAVEKKGKAGKGAKKAAPAEPSVNDLAGNLYFFSASEMDFVRRTLADTLNKEGSTGGKPLELKAALAAVDALPMSADVAMFGRMVASQRDMSVNGAVQVGHAFTVHKAAVDDDYFVAVDDLTTEDDGGSGHLGSNGFGSGTYYNYVNIDVQGLVDNFDGDVEMAKKTVAALVEAIATVSPSAKQNTFACHSLATSAVVEVGNGQPRQWADAFERAVKGEHLAEAAIAAAQAWNDNTDKVYPSQKPARAGFNRITGEGSLEEVVAHALTAFGG